MDKITIVALYKFTDLPAYQELRLPLLNICKTNNIKGTLLLAKEGINGTIAGTKTNIETALNHLQQIPAFKDLEYKISYSEICPFLRMKVKLKQEIVTMGKADIDPKKVVGKHLDSKQWNELLQDPDTILIDTRNTYETNIGTFKNAICPPITNFREFPEYFINNFTDQKDKKIAMYCTGGIRCEKSTAFALEAGFAEVYHLKGGILKYLEETPKEDSLWQGDCFVFDERVAVNHKLEKSIYEQCHGCRHPITQEDMASALYKRGVHCPLCYTTFAEKHYQRAAERQRQMDLAKKRGEMHLGASRDSG